MEFWVLIGLAVIAVLMASGKKQQKLKIEYKRQKALFTEAERSFLGVLETSIEDKYRIMGKIRIADLIAPKNQKNRKNWQTLFNKIAAKHVDYVLCKKDTFEVVAAIELDDSSHNKKSRQKRDNFVDEAFESANLPLVRFKAQRSYQIEVVRERIDLLLNRANNTKDRSEQPLST